MADPRLFDPGPKQRPDRNYDPNEWAKSSDVTWHASGSRMPPKPEPREAPPQWSTMQSQEHYAVGAFHTGSLASAMIRATGQGGRKNVHPYVLSGQFAEPQGNFQADTAKPEVWNDDVANFDPAAVRHLAAGRNLAYRNQIEDEGSISYATARPENLSTWSESTLSDPNAPSHLRALAEHYELVGKRATLGIETISQPTLPGMPGRAQHQTRFHAPQGTVGWNDPEQNAIAHVLQRKR